MKPIRIGLMGFGRIGRQIFRMASRDDRFEVVAICDIGRPEILHNLLMRSPRQLFDVALEGNYLVGEHFRTRLMPTNHPTEIPWDVFGIDFVIDATSRFRSRAELEPHLDNGAGRVLVSTLPEGEIDRVIACGVNDAEARASDRIISASSATTAAMALGLEVLSDSFEIEQATMTSIHAYTSDQSLQDYAGPDYRRSRSGAENIIPNASQSPEWVERLIPSLAGKLSGYTLNVPVQVGNLLDLSVVFADPGVEVEQVNALFDAAAERLPSLVAVTRDPIVSSDVQGTSQSLLFDRVATLKAGTRTMKMLLWYESLGHAGRILDVARAYADLDTDLDERDAGRPDREVA